MAHVWTPRISPAYGGDSNSHGRCDWREGEVVTELTKPPWVERLSAKLDDMIQGLNKSGIAEWVELYREPQRMLYLNFLAGVARGFGVAVGFTLVSALIIVFLGYVARLNLPFIGEFIADIARIVRFELGRP